MRVASKTIYDKTIANLGRITTEMNEASEIATTGRRMNSLSDDPVGLVSVLDIRSSLANINQMGRNISMGRSWLTASETALTQVQDILSEAKALCVQYSSANIGAEERSNAVTIVDSYLKQVLSLANTQVDQRYIFGGTNTDTTPFTLSSDETLVEYSGNDNAFSIKISKDTTIEVGRDGEDVFGDSGTDDDVFQTLIDLKTALGQNDVTAIQDTMDKLDSHMTTITGTISDIGGKNIRLDIRENIIDDLELTYTERKSEIEDADISEAILKLNEIQLTYQAALSASSKIMEMSLVDYI